MMTKATVFKNCKGFSIVEVTVIMVILTTLALISIGTIVNFQQTALLDTTVSEFSNSLHTAQSRSMSGKLEKDEAANDFEEDGLPIYGIRVESDKYVLFRNFQLAGELSTGEDLVAYPLDTNITVSPSSGEVIFERLAGTTTTSTYTFENSQSEEQEVVIKENGLISINIL